MLKTILTMSAATACLTLPAAAESYIRGDGCGGTYVDRKSEMMAGNITGGTRYKCTPFPRKAAATTATPRRTVSSAPRRTTQSHSTQSYAAPTQTYSTPRTYSSGSTYSAGSAYRYAAPAYGYSSGQYVTAMPTTVRASRGGYVSAQPSTVISRGRTISGSPRGTSTYTGSGNYVTTRPHTVTTTGTSTVAPSYDYQYGSTVQSAQPQTVIQGIPRVTGNLANSYTTITETPPSNGFRLSDPDSYVHAGGN